MSGNRPCNCHQESAVGLEGLPVPGEIRAALTAALGAESTWSATESFAEAIPPGELPVAMPSLVGGSGGPNLEALIALAKAHPGLKITLSFGD